MAQARPPAGRGPGRPLGPRGPPRRTDRRARHDRCRRAAGAAHRFARLPSPPRRRILYPSPAAAFGSLGPAHGTPAALLTPRPTATRAGRGRADPRARRQRLRAREHRLGARARPGDRTHDTAEQRRQRRVSGDRHAHPDNGGRHPSRRRENRCAPLNPSRASSSTPRPAPATASDAPPCASAITAKSSLTPRRRPPRPRPPPRPPPPPRPERALPRRRRPPLSPVTHAALAAAPPPTACPSPATALPPSEPSRMATATSSPDPRRAQ